MTECAVCEPATPTEPIDADELALLCKALAHPARVKLLRHLAGIGTCYFGSLSDLLELAPSTVSQHVSILKDAGPHSRFGRSAAHVLLRRAARGSPN